MYRPLISLRIGLIAASFLVQPLPGMAALVNVAGGVVTEGRVVPWPADTEPMIKSCLVVTDHVNTDASVVDYFLNQGINAAKGGSNAGPIRVTRDEIRTIDDITVRNKCASSLYGDVNVRTDIGGAGGYGYVNEDCPGWYSEANFYFKPDDPSVGSQEIWTAAVINFRRGSGSIVIRLTDPGTGPFPWLTSCLPANP